MDGMPVGFDELAPGESYTIRVFIPMIHGVFDESWTYDEHNPVLYDRVMEYVGIDHEYRGKYTSHIFRDDLNLIDLLRGEQGDATLNVVQAMACMSAMVFGEGVSRLHVCERWRGDGRRLFEAVKVKPR